jgi:hypothetical protein
MRKTLGRLKRYVHDFAALRQGIAYAHQGEVSDVVILWRRYRDGSDGRDSKGA